MQIVANILPLMADFGRFQDIYYDYAKGVCVEACLRPRFSTYRMHDAFFAWREDLERVVDREKNLEELDHFKQAAHLAYWLRRRAPIVEYEDMSAVYEEGGIYPDEDGLGSFYSSMVRSIFPLISGCKFVNTTNWNALTEKFHTSAAV